MTYQETLDFISSQTQFVPRKLAPGEEPFKLDAIRRLLSLLGDPQKDLRYVHIAGTNGKGSTTAFLSSILMESGLRVGIYTSPYLERFTERIRLGDTEIPEEDLCRLTETVKNVTEEMGKNGGDKPSVFEMISAIAFLWFREQKADVVVLEVGMGGRLDATNVIDCPDLAVITAIGWDHMETLGDTLPKIAWEKAGIVKPGGHLLAAPQSPAVDAVFQTVCLERKATLHTAALPVRTARPDLEGQSFALPGFPDLHIGLLGTYQIENASLAVQAALLLKKEGWPVTDRAILSGLDKAGWPGRFELLQKNPAVLIDGAHNSDGVGALCRSLETYFPGQKITFVAGVLADKDYGAMLPAVCPLADRVYTVTPPSPRALPAEDLAAWLKERGTDAVPCASVKEAVEQAMDHAGKDGVVCAFGSLYYIGQIRGLFRY